MSMQADHALTTRMEGTMAALAMSKGKRVHLALPPVVHEMMKEAQKETSAETLTEVAKAAFTVYLALLREHKKGKEVVVRADDGKETSYALFLRS